MLVLWVSDTEEGEGVKIVNRKTFLEMPPGTLFQNYRPCTSGSLCAKDETMGNDFLLQPLEGVSAMEWDSSDQMVERLEEMRDNGASHPLGLDCLGRDGCFDNDQLFLVWERADVEALIARLQSALP